ncbi:MAG: P-II family nitrogen regulator [Candidatus Marinimicrobia bacterium]|jgi:nitrogen regulatory protein PII|nr:P-II family nitrogen regulator [Candidatus Neomarinimicrobiota bacterium]MBT3632749.1 P-II family nitrogen regulator [Candidatus Neomarinimicrobiota bacterium]MBT3681859.1 P-II family nitrogen regulator [Candidatus Neomarinimicrobiota bacterium]MBT3760508.1 P-II family nitrogen regulator [Candidatus Neomarinimicrobiota bacterium]MBT3896654.1 P-II family nitrogen regulator [Candidatus Neomarinimicrobiota bacterium]
MKNIIAYIKPHKLSKVTLALHNIEGLPGMSVSDIRGFGKAKTKNSSQSIDDELIDFIPHVKLEIFCRDDLVNQIITTIQESAHTGLHGDGKIYVTQVHQAFRISTGEFGEVAI